MGGGRFGEGARPTGWQKILGGLAKDLRDVCRNLSPEATGDELDRATRVFLLSPPKAGHSLSFPFEVGEGESAVTERGVAAYFDGITELAEAGRTLASPTPVMPTGFDARVLERTRSYYRVWGREYKGMYATIQPNGRPSRRIDYTKDLRLALDVKLAAIEQEQRRLADVVPLVHGYSVHGVLYELSDRYYGEPGSEVKFEVDPHDGTVWVCRMPKEKAPDLAELWRKRVEVRGVAKFRPQKPEMDVEELIPLHDLPTPTEAVRRLRELSPGLMDDESSEAFAARMRGEE